MCKNYIILKYKYKNIWKYKNYILNIKLMNWLLMYWSHLYQIDMNYYEWLFFNSSISIENLSSETWIWFVMKLNTTLYDDGVNRRGIL